MNIQEIIDESETIMAYEDGIPQQLAELINQLAKRVQDLEEFQDKVEKTVIKKERAIP